MRREPAWSPRLVSRAKKLHLPELRLGIAEHQLSVPNLFPPFLANSNDKITESLVRKTQQPKWTQGN